jgi:hypothetical protein
MTRNLASSVKAVARPFGLAALARWVDLRWCFRRRGKPHGLPNRLVVSLTSYPKRFDVLHLTLKTLLTQSVAADVTILWIAHGDMDKLPSNVRALEKDGLTIRATEDLRSYKKIIPALAGYKDAFIVTADDDVYYPSDWLRTFCEAYKPGEKAALSYRAHRMAFDGKALAPYDSWTFEIADPAPGTDVFFTGVGGVFYPPDVLHADVTKVGLLQKLCPTTDDVWLNWMVRLNGAQVRKIGPRRRFREWPGSQEIALQNSNRGGDGGNDRQIANIVSVYGLPGINP